MVKKKNNKLNINGYKKVQKIINLSNFIFNNY